MGLYGYYLEAEYEDGYIHSDRYYDASPFVRHELVNGVATGPNKLNDIIERRPEAIHGRLLRVSLLPDDESGDDHRYDIDWTKLPASARPIRFIDRERDFNTGTGEVLHERVTGLRFGYQYNDENGNNVQQILDII
jgi:hypothetical protein